MAKTAPETIVLKGAEHVIQNEATAGGTIKPGHLIALGSAGTVAVHAVAGGSAPEKAFAFEDDGQGRGIDDAYDSTTHKNVRYGLCAPGVEIYAWLKDAEIAVIGSKLESAGDGSLKVHDPQDGTFASPAVGVRTGQVIAVALQALDLSASPPATGNHRIKVRVI